MPEFPPRTDWEALSELPGVRAVAAAIRRRWNLRVGLVTRAGKTLPLGKAVDGDSSDSDLPLCDLFRTRSDDGGSCHGSLLQWAGTEGNQLRKCHANLNALVAPIGGREGDQAVLFVSGFVPRDDGFEGLATSLARADALGLERNQVAALFARVPNPSASDQEALWALLGVLVDELRSELEQEQSTDPFRNDYSNIIGQSTEILRLFALLDRVAGNDSTILIHGENGTGKELFARAVHANSLRRENSFVTLNCSALNDNLLDSELFGHRRGAFTGAVTHKKGLFELASGGTLLLDEIGDMSPIMQAKLLRVIQERTYVPVGCTVTRNADVRIITASNRKLDELVEEGQFREDLYYRLNVISLIVPPLRRRRSDISLLVDHFLSGYARSTGTTKKLPTDEILSLFIGYDWPGNVRELRHEVERLVVLSGVDEQLDIDLVSRRIVVASNQEARLELFDEDATLHEAVEALERRMIIDTLEQSGWNKTRAAKKLGVSRRNLIRKVQRFNLRPSSTTKA